MKVDINKFHAILKREESQRDQLPEHTLDWYTYTNRVILLREIEAIFYAELILEEERAESSYAPKKKSSKRTGWKDTDSSLDE